MARPTSSRKKGRAAWIVATFHELNKRHFDGKLSRPLFDRIEGVDGAYTPSVGGRLLPMICIGVKPLRLGERRIEDVLLHEMIHHALWELHGADLCRREHHGPLFIREANRIAAELGLSRRLRKPESKAAGHWPDVCRPAGYYLHGEAR